MTDFLSRTETYLSHAKIIVVKVGSALLVDDESGSINADWLTGLAEDLQQLAQAGCSIVIVSSGAIALGRHPLGRHDGRLKLEEKQAAAAIGQIRLAGEWQQALAAKGLKSAQILLSPDDTETRRRHLNARATLLTLLKEGFIPVVNENDTVATAEIRYGDNDRLAARVAQMISANALVLLSDIDGLYDQDPRQNRTARHLPEVKTIDEDIEAMAGAAHASYASGGMVTKIEAARIATTAGCHMVICSGLEKNPIGELRQGAKCTWFQADSNPPQARKKWIAGGLKPSGIITVDAGAVAALERGKSLLAAGITAVSGSFDRGDLVTVANPDGVEVARGLSHYSATATGQIAGCNSTDIQGILGYQGRDEVIHADDLVLTRKPEQTQQEG